MSTHSQGDADGFLAALGAVAVASAYLEDELHRAAVAALGGSNEAERFVQTLPGPNALVKLVTATHGKNSSTAELADRCRENLDERNRYLHGVIDFVFADGPVKPGQKTGMRMRNRKKKGDYDVPTVEELYALAQRLREAGTHVWIQEMGRSVEWQEEAWKELVAG